MMGTASRAQVGTVEHGENRSADLCWIRMEPDQCKVNRFDVVGNERIMTPARQRDMFLGKVGFSNGVGDGDHEFFSAIFPAVVSLVQGLTQFPGSILVGNGQSIVTLDQILGAPNRVVLATAASPRSACQRRVGVLREDFASLVLAKSSFDGTLAKLIPIKVACLSRKEQQFRGALRCVAQVLADDTPHSKRNQVSCEVGDVQFAGVAFGRGGLHVFCRCSLLRVETCDVLHCKHAPGVVRLFEQREPRGGRPCPRAKNRTLRCPTVGQAGAVPIARLHLSQKGVVSRHGKPSDAYFLRHECRDDNAHLAKCCELCLVTSQEISGMFEPGYVMVGEPVLWEVTFKQCVPWRFRCMRYEYCLIMANATRNVHQKRREP
eukprot:m.26787 g.26787  ORF g.26787 m.26787 type:complete len:377 (-) comp6354_c0_seq1:4340-5470(-)